MDPKFHTRQLQRYMPKSRALQTISDNGLYFRRIDCFPDDQSEGSREYDGNNEKTIHEVLKEVTNLTEEDSRSESHNQMQNDKKNMFIQSWYWDDNMSESMWEKYAQYYDEKDCALFVVDRFKMTEYFNKIMPVGFDSQPAKYVDNKLSQRDPAFTKKMEFESEREFRLLINLEQPLLFNEDLLPRINRDRSKTNIHGELVNNARNGGRIDPKKFEYVDECGFIVKAPLALFLEHILIPSDASEAFCTNMNNKLQKHGHTIRCERVNLSNIKS